MTTLAAMKRADLELSIHCEGSGNGYLCAHYVVPSIDQLIQYFGTDFNVVERREEFLSRFRCERCGERRATLRIAPVGKNGGGAGVVHNYGPLPSEEERAERAAAFEAEFRRAGHKTNAELAQESRALLREAKRAEKAGENFIGAPSPWAHRKGPR